MERRINNNRDNDGGGGGGGGDGDFLAMWFEQDPKTIFLALWSEI